MASPTYIVHHNVWDPDVTKLHFGGNCVEPVGSINIKVNPDLTGFPQGGLAPEENHLDKVKSAEVLRELMYSSVDENGLEYTPFFTKRGAYVTVEDNTEGRSRVFHVSIYEVD